MSTTKRISLDSSLKRIAWAYGCAKRGSLDESNLRALLLQKSEAVKADTPTAAETKVSPHELIRDENYQSMEEPIPGVEAEGYRVYVKDLLVTDIDDNEA